MMKFDWFKITIMGCLSFILIACNQVTNPNIPSNATSLPTDTIQVIETQTAHVSPTQGDSQMTPSLPAPAGDLANDQGRTAPRTDLRDQHEDRREPGHPEEHLGQNR